MITDSYLDEPIRYRHPNGQRCGWCIGGDHRNCVVTVEMGKETTTFSGTVRATFTTSWKTTLWRCECREDHAHPSSRCLKCLRPGVDVDFKSRCIDHDDCKAYRVEFGTYIRPSAPVLRDDDEEEFDDDRGEMAV